MKAANTLRRNERPLHDRARLRELGASSRAGYLAALPFPHAVFDGFLGEKNAREIAEAFPAPTHPDWKRRDYEEQKRLGQLQREGFRAVGEALHAFLLDLGGMAFLDFLEALTGREGLIADPHYTGAGPSLTERGGFLALHADFDRDRRRHLARALTVVYYASPDFEPSWGGGLALASATGEVVTTIAPIFDRLLVMDHGDAYFHGHPDPLGGPEGALRASVASYYYVAEPSAAKSAHGAIWLGKSASR